MKGKEAIAKTRIRLESEFNERKKVKLTGMKRHKQELEDKIQKLQSELQTLNIKIMEVENSSFRCSFLSEESRKAQSQASKQSRTLS